jgi:hypothetical protein
VAIQVFISYKRQDPKRNAWVERLYQDLRIRGIDAKLDVYEVGPGQSFSEYMTRSIRNVDHVLFIITPVAIKAVESGYGALAFEMQIANARRLAQKHGFSIIPIFREGEATTTYLSDHRYLDFRNDARYEAQLDELIGWLTGRIQPPPLGSSIDRLGYYDGPITQKAVEAHLRQVGKLKILGYPYPFGHPSPKVGERGFISPELGPWEGQISYTRLAALSHWDIWSKDFYTWELEWNEQHGIVVTGRQARSSK